MLSPRLGASAGRKAKEKAPKVEAARGPAELRSAIPACKSMGGGSTAAQSLNLVEPPTGTRAVRIGKALLGFYDERQRRRPFREQTVAARGGADFMLLRLVSIERLRRFRFKHGLIPVEDDRYWLAALPCLLKLAEGRDDEGFTWQQLTCWAIRFAPDVLTKRGEVWMWRQWHWCVADPNKYKVTADDVAIQLQITEDERLELKLNTIGAIDRTKEQRMADRRARDAARKRKTRAAAGAVPRDQSLSATKPWQLCGMSRPQWYRLPIEDRLRKLKEAETDSSAAIHSSHRMWTNLSHEKEQQSESGSSDYGQRVPRR
jgi:hypothetical protein